MTMEEVERRLQDLDATRDKLAQEQNKLEKQLAEEHVGCAVVAIARVAWWLVTTCAHRLCAAEREYVPSIDHRAQRRDVVSEATGTAALTRRCARPSVADPNPAPLLCPARNAHQPHAATAAP